MNGGGQIKQSAAGGLLSSDGDRDRLLRSGVRVVFGTGSTERRLAVIGRDCSGRNVTAPAPWAFASLLLAMVPDETEGSRVTVDPPPCIGIGAGQVDVLRSSVTGAGRFNVPHLESDADAFAVRRMFWIGSVSRMWSGSSVADGAEGIAATGPSEMEPPRLRGSSRIFQAGMCWVILGVGG